VVVDVVAGFDGDERCTVAVFLVLFAVLAAGFTVVVAGLADVVIFTGEDGAATPCVTGDDALNP